jgi:four helix bundle protein
MADFKKLHVWHKAHALSLNIDRVSKTIRATQYASLRSQIFRAALSIPANIAEGRRKTSEREFARFLGIAIGSSSELESHLIFARDAKVIPEHEFVSLVSQTIEVRKMLYALIRCLSTSDAPPAPSSNPRSELPAAPPKAPSW